MKLTELPRQNTTEHLHKLAYLKLTELPRTLIQNEFCILLGSGTESHNEIAPAFLL